MSIIAIFGSTGDLTYRKLLPGLVNLKKNGKLPATTKILCIGRRDWDTQTYLRSAHDTADADITPIESMIDYFRVRLDAPEDFDALFERVQTLGIEDTVFYLALPPSLFPTVASGLHRSGLVKKGDTANRIVFEKPFGEDLSSAREINSLLWQYFDESQIYRIDHYLGKEMIQNILALRFANRIFESDWHKDSIDRVRIRVKEEDGVGTRGGYYDTIGAMRDMVQSHLLQMLALTAMEAPAAYDAQSIRKEKVSLLKKLSINPSDIVTGQYEGYTEEDKVDPGSTTETFVQLKVQIDDSRWRNVPFYLVTGKMLDNKASEIIIDFKHGDKSSCLWPSQNLYNNQLVIKVAPEEGMSFRMNVKESGLDSDIIPSKMDYYHGKDAFGNIPEAYEKLLLEILNKNPMLFARWDEIETTWQFTENVRQQLSDTPIVYKNEHDLKHKLNGNNKGGTLE